MSIRAMTAVWEHSRQTLGTRLVVLALADYAHDDGGNAYPSVSTLAAKAYMSERNVQYALRRLEQAGEIERQGTHVSGATIWRITLPGMGAKSAPAKSAPGAKHDRGGVQKPTKRDVEICTLTVTGIEPTNEPSVTPPISPSKKKAMTADWSASESSIAYAVEWGIPRELVSEVVEEFRAYWMTERPKEKRDGWDLTFKGQVRRVAHQYRGRARASPTGQAKKTTTDLILEAGRRVEERHRERDRNYEDAGADRRGVRTKDEGGRAQLGAVDRGLDDGAGGRAVEPVWRERG
jgi:DNA-binding Lrp family transcriptional regulator